MKRLIQISAMFIALLLLFASCGANTVEIGNPDTSKTEPADQTKARIAVLNGTTGYGMAPLSQQLMTDTSSRVSQIISTIDYLEDATLISPRLISGDVDIAAVPTNLAAVLYAKTKGEIQVLGINTLGVLYLMDTTVTALSDGTLDNTVKSLSDLKGQTVYVPGTGTNPEYILRAILKKTGIEESVKIDYTYTTPDALASAVLTNKAGLAVLPEPKFTVTQYKYLSVRIMLSHMYGCAVGLDFSKEWKEAFGCDLVQGCFVVRKSFAEEHPQVVKAFIEEYSAAHQWTADRKLDAITDIGLLPGNLFTVQVTSSTAAGTQSKEEYRKESYQNLLSQCHLVAQFGDEIKEPLMTYWQALYNIIPSAVGGTMPDEGIFCKLLQ